jgi:hypothetical protein
MKKAYAKPHISLLTISSGRYPELNFPKREKERELSS